MKIDHRENQSGKMWYFEQRTSDTSYWDSLTLTVTNMKWDLVGQLRLLSANF